MSDHEYLPTDYVDEVCPPFRAHPSDWIITTDGRIALVACPDLGEHSDRPGQDLVAGEVLDFDRCESLGKLTLTVRASAGRLQGYRPIPSLSPTANCFVIDGDQGAAGSDHLDDCIEAWIENENLDGEREIEVSVWRWTTDRWRLTADPTGARAVRFERVVAP